jgi:alanine racemase
VRRAGVALPILILFPIPADAARVAAQAGLTVTAGDRELLERTLRALGRRRRAGRRPLSVALEVETGLGRGGFAGLALADAARLVDDHPGARLVTVWSHLTAAQDVPRSASQAQRFDAATALLAGGGFALDRGLAATGALLSDSVPPYEGIRPGLSVYGLAPDDLGRAGQPLPDRVAAAIAGLRPVMSLHARPVRVADLPADWGVSYGPSFTTRRPSRIATLPLGYGDGWSRAWTNRAEAIVRGRRVPLVGTVAMDAIMADVSDVPGGPVGIDDEFTLLGAQGDERISVSELARSRTTISWEVVTTMAARLPRVYHARAVPVGIRTMTVERFRWPTSSSGTATSATSRSTPS